VVGHPVVADPDLRRGSNSGHRGGLTVVSRQPEEDDGANRQVDRKVAVRHVDRTGIFISKRQL